MILPLYVLQVARECKPRFAWCGYREVGWKCVSENKTETSLRGIKLRDLFFSQRVRVLLTSAVTTVMLTAAALHTCSPRLDVSTILQRWDQSIERLIVYSPGSKTTPQSGVSFTNKDPNWQSLTFTDTFSSQLVVLPLPKKIWHQIERGRKKTKKNRISVCRM